MPFDSSGLRPPTRYTSFVDGSSFSTRGMRDNHDAMKRSQDTMMRAQRSHDSMMRAQQDADRFARSMRQHRNPTQSFSPRLSFYPRAGGVGGAFGAVVRLAVLALVVLYALPHLLRPTPTEILSARQFVTANVESAAAEWAPPDVAGSIDAFLDAISR